MKSLHVRLVASLFALLLTAWGTGALPASSAPSLLAGLPLHFEPRTLGSGEKAFVARARGYRVAIRADEVVVVPRGADHSVAPVLLLFARANPVAELAGADALPGRSHYLIGRDHARWRREVPHFGRVEARGVYPGIDLAYYGNRGAVELDVTMRPGADAAAVAIDVEGASTAALDDDGDLVLGTAAGELRLRRPVAYQPVSSTTVPCPAPIDSPVASDLRRRGELPFPWMRPRCARIFR
ncbi:MAG: hypothetical protein HYV63_22860 [Candidatus Schekmanbacteria bacterium]|nr:hypothetical protein [Candidatus Schekmanbacteria bacterium]